MSSELDRKFSSLRPVFKDLVIKKAALTLWSRTQNYALSHAGQKYCPGGCYFSPKFLIFKLIISGDSQESARSILIGHMRFLKS